MTLALALALSLLAAPTPGCAKTEPLQVSVVGEAIIACGRAECFSHAASPAPGWKRAPSPPKHVAVSQCHDNRFEAASVRLTPKVTWCEADAGTCHTFDLPVDCNFERAVASDATRVAVEGEAFSVQVIDLVTGATTVLPPAWSVSSSEDALRSLRLSGPKVWAQARTGTQVSVKVLEASDGTVAVDLGANFTTHAPVVAHGRIAWLTLAASKRTDAATSMQVYEASTGRFVRSVELFAPDTGLVPNFIDVFALAGDGHSVIVARANGDGSFVLVDLDSGQSKAIAGPQHCR